MLASSTAPPDRTGDRVAAPRRGSIAVARAWWQAHMALRREREALEDLGTALANDPAYTPTDERARTALADVASRDAAIAALQAALDASLQEDRTDFAEARAWLQPLVVFRGVATRCLIRDRFRRARDGRRLACRALGRAAGDEGETRPAGTWSKGAIEARMRAAAATAALEVRLTAMRDVPSAAVARRVGLEAIAIGKPVVHEVRARVFPRIPALAGLAAGWWIARTFTDSRFSATLHALGIGAGPRRVVSTQQLHAMEFWLPIAAAALCSYASSRLAMLVRSRYAPAPPEASRSTAPRS